MFQRFSDQARRVVVLAQEEARMLNHNSIGTEHLLLGLIREEEGIAARVLRSLGLDLAAVRQQVADIVGQGKQGQGKQGQGEQGQDEQGQPEQIPFTPRAKKALELSLREALQVGDSHIGTEHLLLGLVRVGDGVAAQVLVRLGTDLHVVRHQVIQLLAAGLPADVIAAGEAESRLAALSDQVRQLSHEVERLRGLLRQHGLDPGEHTA